MISVISRTNEGLPFWITDAKKIVLSSRIKKDNSLNGDFFDFDTFNIIEVKSDSDQNQGRVASLGWAGLT